MIREVDIEFSNLAQKQLKKLPKHVLDHLHTWLDIIKLKGFNEVRSIASYHDEPLKGKRTGQRSVRLNRAYRVIYEETIDGLVIYILVIEVNKHDY